MTATAADPQHSWFKRILLPGLALKAFVIGGGYATGRELAEFFLPSGPRGGLMAIAFATVIMSLLSVITFVVARRLRAFDYRTFFKRLVGPGWIAFELAYLALVVLILAVYGAAAGAIGTAVFGAAGWVGTVVLMLGIAGVVAFGNKAAEELFTGVSYLLYGVYALFIVFALATFGHLIGPAFAAHSETSGWAMGGLTYASYNTVGAVIILPVLRHLVSDRDAVVSGIIAGPLTMVPALLFFIPMVAFYPAIKDAPLPSDFLLQKMGQPWFHYLFQAMIFSALLESGTSAVHAVNERISQAWQAQRGTELTHRARLTIGLVLLALCMFAAGRFGLVDLIAKGYRALAYIFLAVFVLPLLTVGVWKIVRNDRDSEPALQN
ncbi:hypothetical protein LZ016_01185 [Sphingomonas sp. SM33]|uniref:Membrane protein YkvI n=1 Tax=Sphingomonas telluris TaxID=2907998 RepID=A0ABS9VIC0_9SPHN|nr:hypothetical protein [Sphingomonas telluris]